MRLASEKPGAPRKGRWLTTTTTTIATSLIPLANADIASRALPLPAQLRTGQKEKSRLEASPPFLRYSPDPALFHAGLLVWWVGAMC